MSESSGGSGSRGQHRGGNQSSNAGRRGPGGHGGSRRNAGDRDGRRDRNRGGERGGYRGRRDDNDRGRRDDRRGGRDERRDNRGGQGNRDHRNGGRPNRGGQGQGDDRRRDRHNGPHRSGYREERISQRNQEPEIPSDVSPKELDPGIRQELRSLSKDNADKVAGHLVMAAALMDKDPEKALAHARAAKDRGGRVPITRETLGIAAYHAGQWKEALTELRAARRMAGGPGMLAVMADCERGLGHPDKAVELGRSPESEELDPEGRAELAIVVAGAQHDLGDTDAALAALQPESESTDLPAATALRVTYAYADALLATGDTVGAREWFERAVEMDTENVLDAEDRLRELKGA
ncbi:tetratricopeptide repeat protein [Corynebacterium sp.]|uniref:tetratricopeptide repeat protein n=1 Tax=Corynebacterium sp. TaxID=1720 RepID=UPI0025C28DFE|nr:tetratricopeptide repeat protein [Corynebacterium sp.]